MEVVEHVDPADGQEVAAAWTHALTRGLGPRTMQALALVAEGAALLKQVAEAEDEDADARFEAGDPERTTMKAQQTAQNWKSSVNTLTVGATAADGGTS